MKKDTATLLKNAIIEFNRAKKAKQNDKIRYFKGYCEGIMKMALELGVMDKSELKTILSDPLKYETEDSPSPLDETINSILNDLETPSIYRKLKK